MKKRKIPIFDLDRRGRRGWHLLRHHASPGEIVLTGIVTTDEVIVSPEIQGRLQQLFVKEGDAVTNGELLGVIQPQEQQADVAFYASSEQQYAAQVAQAEADLENARLTYQRDRVLVQATRRSRRRITTRRERLTMPRKRASNR